MEGIEEAISQLSQAKQWELVTRLRERFNDEWDREIEEDLADGPLAFLPHEVDEEIAAEGINSV